MDKNIILSEQQVQSFVECGSALSSFYLEDPSTGKLDSLIGYFSEIDTSSVAATWPFCQSKEQEVESALTLMKNACIREIQQYEEIAAAEALRTEPRSYFDGAPLTDMTTEYRRLFIGPGKFPAPAWGSVYTDPDEAIFGASTLKLRAWMRKHDISRMSDEKTPEDHIGLMVALCVWVAKNKPELLGELLSDHVLTWSSHMLTYMEERSANDFYRGLALLTKITLEELGNYLQVEVVLPHYYR